MEGSAVCVGLLLCQKIITLRTVGKYNQHSSEGEQKKEKIILKIGLTNHRYPNAAVRSDAN